MSGLVRRAVGLVMVDAAKRRIATRLRDDISEAMREARNEPGAYDLFDVMTTDPALVGLTP